MCRIFRAALQLAKAERKYGLPVPTPSSEGEIVEVGAA
jgi:hypothetical protein